MDPRFSTLGFRLIVPASILDVSNLLTGKSSKDKTSSLASVVLLEVRAREAALNSKWDEGIAADKSQSEGTLTRF